MVTLALSDAVQLGLIGAWTVLVTTLGAIVTALIAKSAAAAAAVKVAGKVEEVKTTLAVSTECTDRKLDDLETIGKQTRTLVNGAMTNQLRLTSIALDRVAAVTRDPADVDAASQARHVYEEHLKAQAGGK